MGRATRWLKGLFGLKKEKTDSGGGENERRRPDSGLGRSGRETGDLCLNPNTIPPNITPAEAAWLKSFYCDSEKERNKHAIAVAAATAAAADAAVAAAQAAVAVVRLTSQGRGGGTGFGSREKCAAIKIQTVFRGYLARKAHRALKGLVKLQALVRGYLVRKQATATLHSMQALIRAQATVRAHRTRARLILHHIHYPNEISQPLFPARKSVERFDEANSSRLSASFDSTNTSAIEESSTKIVEVDTGRPKSRSKRTNTDSGDESSCQTVPSPRFYRHPARLSIPAATDYRNSQELSEWGLTGEECRGFCTAQSTPRFASNNNNNNNSTGDVATPAAKSISMESLLFRSMVASPNYMANTQSFKAKLRSQSAPKQRPEPAGGSNKRRITMESRNSVSGVRMQRSCSQVQEVLNFKNAVIGRIGRSLELVRQPQH